MSSIKCENIAGMAISTMIFTAGVAAFVLAGIFFPALIAPLILVILLGYTTLFLFLDADVVNTQLWNRNLRQKITSEIGGNPELFMDKRFAELARILNDKNADVEMLLKSKPACEAFTMALKNESHPIHQFAQKMYDSFDDLRLRAILAGKSPNDIVRDEAGPIGRENIEFRELEDIELQEPQ
jgi:hypothetical protein